MKKVLIGIATYQRPEKLKRLLKSLEAQTYKNFFTYIVFDANDVHSLVGIEEYTLPKQVFINTERGYVIGCWNLAYRVPGFDAYMMLCDDVELHQSCLESALERLESLFPDEDGVIGLTQECPGAKNFDYKNFGQVLMGRKFVERYKDVNYQVCCPHYTHLRQDEEMWQYATSLDKFNHCKEAKLNHYHPSFLKNEMDTTHHIVRHGIIQEDNRIFADRQRRGVIWGQSWEK